MMARVWNWLGERPNLCMAAVFACILVIAFMEANP